MSQPDEPREMHVFTKDYRSAPGVDFRPNPVSAEMPDSRTEEEPAPKDSPAVVSADSSEGPGTPSLPPTPPTQTVEHPSQLPSPEAPVSAVKVSGPPVPSVPSKPASSPVEKSG